MRSRTISSMKPIITRRKIWEVVVVWMVTMRTMTMMTMRTPPPSLPMRRFIHILDGYWIILARPDLTEVGRTNEVETSRPSRLRSHQCHGQTILQKTQNQPQQKTIWNTHPKTNNEITKPIKRKSTTINTKKLTTTTIMTT